MFFSLFLALQVSPAYADPPIRLRVLSASWCGSCAPFDRELRREGETLTVRVRGREVQIHIERVNLDRADPFTLQSIRGRRLPVLELLGSNGSAIAVHEGAPDSTEDWVKHYIEAREDFEIEWTPPVRTVATGEWSGRSDDSSTASPTSPTSLPEKHRWIFEEIADEPTRIRAGGT